MNNKKYLLYINEQSNKQLVNSIQEAKRQAECHTKYRPSLRIECYSAPTTACIWTYDYKTRSWVNIADYHNSDRCCLAEDSQISGQSMSQQDKKS
jgi:hypothetical protein